MAVTIKGEIDRLKNLARVRTGDEEIACVTVTIADVLRWNFVGSKHKLSDKEAFEILDIMHHDMNQMSEYAIGVIDTYVKERSDGS